MPWIVVYRFRDNNGREAETLLRLPDALSFAGASARAEALAERLSALSDALLFEFEVIRSLDGPAGSIAQPDARVVHTAVLFYTAGDDIASIRVPAINLALVEGGGSYADIRITRDSANAQGLLGVLDSLMVGAVDPVGRPYGDFFLVGGRDYR